MASGDPKRPGPVPTAESVGQGSLAPADPHRDLSGALHDVSNALTVMLGWVQEARSDEASRESVAYALRIIEQRARIARDLARRAIGAQVSIIDQDALVDATLEDAVEALSVMAARVGVTVRKSGDTRGTRIPAAADASQIVTNLVMNALAHAPEGSQVIVSVEATDRAVLIDVRDEGKGVAETRRDSIFAGDTRREGGAGVGLRYARALARGAGGDLELIAEPGGARFRLTWLRIDAAPKPPVSAARLRVLEGTRVLVIEDDSDVNDLLEASLSARGAVVTIARSQAELALALFHAHDAALIDLSPIEDDVAGAFAALRKAAPNARLVVMTGTAGALPNEVSTEGVRLVRKPFEVSEIVTALTEGRAKS